MTQPTIDSEVATLVKWSGAPKLIAGDLKQAITNLIAQEANKAVIKKLEDVMVKIDYTDSDTLITQKALRTHNNIQRELSQLTADKEQA